VAATGVCFRSRWLSPEGKSASVSGGQGGDGIVRSTRDEGATLLNDAKRGAQEALFAAIQDQAEHNMRAALRAPEKAALLRELAEAYRLTAGRPVSSSARRKKQADSGESSNGRPR
jgi:hypothetical protein